MLSRRKQVVFLAITFLAIFHLFEIGYRAYQRVALGIPMFAFLGAPAADNNFETGGTQLLVGHPLFHYVLNPKRPGHTADFLRVTEEVARPGRTIICMGGSSTYGTGLSATQAYPTQLQRALRQTSAESRVLNAGVPGWSLPHQVARYIFDFRERTPRPDLIVLYIGYNDTWSNIARRETLPGHLDGLRHFPHEMPAWTNYRFLFWVVGRAKLATGWDLAPTHVNDFAFQPREEMRVNASNLGRFRREFELLLDLAKKDGVRVVVALQDTNGEFEAGEKELFEQVRDAVRETAVARKVSIVDTRAITQGRKEYFSDLIHHNEAGARVVAQAVAKAVVEEFSRN